MKRSRQTQLTLFDQRPAPRPALPPVRTDRPNRLKHLSTLGSFVDLSADQDRELDTLLVSLEQFVATVTDGDLPTVENWVARFIRIFNGRTALEPHRKAAFSHLLRKHNEALEPNRTEATK